MTVWGGQRLWTKGRPKNLTQRHVPILVRADELFQPTPRDDTDVLTADLRTRMSGLLDTAQRDYPEEPSPGEDPFWLPAHLGGTAPTPGGAASA